VYIYITQLLEYDSHRVNVRMQFLTVSSWTSLK